jgi:hypothetical protein
VHSAGDTTRAAGTRLAPDPVLGLADRPGGGHRRGGHVRRPEHEQLSAAQQHAGAALDYSAFETAVVMLAVRLADGRNWDDADRGDWTDGMAGG